VDAAVGGKHYTRESLEAVLSMTAIAGDFAMIVSGFFLANRLCQSELMAAGIGGLRGASILGSFNFILLGSAIALWSLVGRDLYTCRSLMTPSNIGSKLAAALGFCLLALTGISAAVRTDPLMARIWFIGAGFIGFLGIYNWRLLLSRILQHPALFSRLRRRLVVIGGGMEAMRIRKALGGNSDLEFVGWIQAIKPNDVVELESYRLGPLHELEDILRRNEVSVAVLTEPECLQREGVSFVTKTCEKEHVQFKMVPHFFEILISGIRPDTIGGIPLLGVNCLPLSGYRSRIAKRIVDIAGALIGLALSAPIIAVFGALVYWESPGPVLYRQIRQGRNGRLFYILKLRSMHVNAESQGKAQWAHKNDQRRLRIGAFMRKWNIDEVPQFWNVLRGEMSLVGPRPERPELIARFKSKIPHYQARHLYRPGMTGWAQVNGWRGNTDLEERIRHDIWYLENWSFWLDFRIMAQTFFSRENAY
jgi:exopolysaccharide biosynthesis polyprenyl glycosylphosphotransferase